jgi:signal transduction histidine kinase/DNA-binding response OmpR family regulator
MCRVLILDDDKYSAETVKLILENSGEASADVVSTAEDALLKVANKNQVGKPYEVFIVDQRLGVGKDGIDVFKDLKAMSPDSDGIIFTGYEDKENGLRAYEAGAFRYLSKPFDNSELLFLLKAIKQWRKEQREHSWQKLFSDMMKDILQHSEFIEVARIIVNSSLKLGFERAHLFWVPTQKDANNKGELVGIACAGEGLIPNFENHLFPLRDWYDLNRSSKKHLIFFNRERKSKQVRRQLEKIGYQLPVQKAIILPLWHGVTLSGALLLDYGQKYKTLTEHENSLLALFAGQVSIALDRTRIYNHEQRLLKESAITRNIGRQITTNAALMDTEELLEEARREIGTLMDVSNFSVILVDQETGNINCHLLYRDNKFRSTGGLDDFRNTLEEYLLKQSNKVFIPKGVKEFIRDKGLQTKGRIPSSFLGVLLRVRDQVIGGIVIKKFGHSIPFTAYEKDLLISVADQIAGAIQIRRLSENDKEDAKRLQVLQQAGIDLLRVIQKHNDYFWYTVLTIITADFGLGFNRALLFLLDDNGMDLVCRGAIGTESLSQAIKDWKRDKKRSYNFDDYFYDLEKKKVKYTEFNCFSEKIRLNIATVGKSLERVWNQGVYQIIPEQDILSSLPLGITEQVELFTCAILPLRIGKAVKGLVIVDNKHNRSSLNQKSLNSLQTLLNNSGQIYETLRQQEKSKELLSSNYHILNQASPKPSKLKETLDRICATARKIMDADWVLVYPLLEGERYRFDTANASHAGELKYSIDSVITNKPSLHGITSYVLENELLVIHNVDDSNMKVGHKRVASNVFIQKEGVKALIGIAINDVQTSQPVGILYFDYRTAQDFTQLEIHHARSFASLIGYAISNTRKFDERRLRLRMEAALKTVEAIGAELNLQKMIEKVLEKLHSFFSKTTLCVLMYDEDEQTLKFAPSALKFYEITNPQFVNQQSFPINGKSLACKAARRALRTGDPEVENPFDLAAEPGYLALIPETTNEFCVCLMGSDRKLLGVLVLERSGHEFDDDDDELIRMIALQLSLGMERAIKTEKLDFQSTVAVAYIWAADLAHDINHEVGKILNWAYLIKEKSGDVPMLAEYAKRIEQVASNLSSAGPWTSSLDQVINLDEVIERDAGKLARQKNIRIQIDPGCPGLHISLNPLALQRVIRQLIRNADQAMAKMPDKKMVISTRPINDNTAVEIEIRDFGTGISPLVRSSILSHRTTTKGRGGYGLMFTRQMVESMGGKIRLSFSEPGQGTAFSIRFPVVENNKSGQSDMDK